MGIQLLPILRIKQNTVIYLIPIGKHAEIKSIKILNYLRKHNIASFVDYNASEKKRIHKASKNKNNYAILYGKRELRNKELMIKNMHSGFQKIMKINQIIPYFQYLINKK